MIDTTHLENIIRLLRHHILTSTNHAGSGHVTSSLSAVELMATLFFTGLFKYDIKKIANPNNDRIIFSKGHASPLLYALWSIAGAIKPDDLMNLRDLASPLEGHPTNRFPYAEVATGSLGQGLSIGVGMALNAQYVDKLSYRTYVLLGDSELAEGSNWEAFEIAAHYNLHQLIGILDCNRLGQRGETMHGHNCEIYASKAEAFGWDTVLIDGHNVNEIYEAYKKAHTNSKPTLIIGKTYKGKGVSFLEDKEGWHGKALNDEQLQQALKEIGTVDDTITYDLPHPENIEPTTFQTIPHTITPIPTDTKIAVREAYGSALLQAISENTNIIVMDAEVSNSTGTQTVKQHIPERFFEMYIAEQNMVGTAVGLAERGKTPFVSTFGAFLTRAFDQIRMAQYSHANIKLCGSHVGVSIGEDGASQMALEDIAMMRSIPSATILYPSDAISMEKLVLESAKTNGIVYLRSTREKTPILYSTDEQFPIGEFKIMHQSNADALTIIAAGITLHEAMKTYDLLQQENIHVGLIDLYSIQPLDIAGLEKIAKKTSHILVVEDHYAHGGIGEAVAMALTGKATIHHLCVTQEPHSATPQELLQKNSLDSQSIYTYVKKVVAS